jgi:hypothetical protein
MYNIPAIYNSNFKKNLAYLKSTNPFVYDLLERSTVNPTMEKTRDGSLTFKANGKYIESKYNPGLHARRSIEGRTGWEKTVLFLGCGLGYHINVFLSKYRTKCIVIEKSPYIFKAALYIIEPEFFKSVVPIVGFATDDLVEKLGFLLMKKISIVRHPAGTQLDPDYYNSVEKIITRKLKERLASKTTETRTAGLWLRNILKNLSHLGAGYYGTKKLHSLFNGPVILVASGPFLEDIIDDLRKLSIKLPVVSLLPSAPYLIKNNIEPDLIVTTDAGFGNRYRFISYTRTPLFSTYSSDVAILKNWPGRKYLFSHDLSFERNLVSLKNCSFTVPMQGTASIVMILLARLMGFSQIYLAGFDFAFRGVKDHHQAAGFDDHYLSTSNRISSWHTSVINGFRVNRFVHARSQKGVDINSSYKLIMYKRWLENEIIGTDLIRMNEGARISGIKYSSPCSLNMSIPDKKTDFQSRMRSIKKCKIPAENVLADLISLKRKIEHYMDLSKKSNCEKIYRTFYGKIPEVIQHAEIENEAKKAITAFKNSISYMRHR